MRFVKSLIVQVLSHFVVSHAYEERKEDLTVTTRIDKKKRLPMILILLGGISLMFLLASSGMALGGISAGAVALGLVLLLRSKNRGRSDVRNMLCVFLLGITLGSFSGCTVKVPMVPNVGKLELKETIPIEAGLLITEETRSYIFKGNPESFTGSARPHEFPLGQALESASYQTFSQVFQKVTIARTPLEAKSYKVSIAPMIENFHFRYDQLSYAGFAVAVVSKIKVRVTLASGEIKIWEKAVESPEQRKGPWVINPSYEQDAGAAASDALSFTLREIATEIAQDASISQLLKGQ